MASSLSCSLVAKEWGEYGGRGEEVSRGGDRGRGDSTHPLLPCESAICLMTSRSSQNCSLSAYSERLGWDWLVRDCLSASTHATREELGSGGGCPLWNFPVRRPLNVCTQSKCVLTYKLSHDCKNTIVFPSCYPFSGLHGNMATPSLLHTSSNSHSVERQRRLYCACKKQEIVLGYRELNVKLYWLQGVK